MNWSRGISFKSIPNYIIILPIFSLMLVTFIIIYITYDIKDEMIENEKNIIRISHFEEQKRLLQSRTNQLIQEIHNLTQYEINELHAALPIVLETFLNFEENTPIAVTAEKTKVDRLIRNFNQKRKLYTIALLSKSELGKRCRLVPGQCEEIFMQQAGFLRHFDPEKKETVYHNLYAQKAKNSDDYFVIELNHAAVHQKIASQTIDMIGSVQVAQGEFFHILDETGALLSPINGDEVHQLFQPENIKNYFVKGLLDGKHNEIFFEYPEPSSAAADHEIYFAKRYVPFKWIIAAQKPFSLLDDKSVKLQAEKIHYFNNRIKELTIIIILVALIVIAGSFFAARIITRVFKRFRKHIIEQNKSLKSFNKRLSLKVKEKTVELHKSEARYRTIFERSPDSIFILEDETINYCNEAALKMFTRNLKSTLIGTSIYELFPDFQPDGNNSRKLLQDYLAITESLGHSRFEWLVQKVDRTTFFVDVWLQHIELEGKSASYVVFRNIDAQKKAQEKIREQHKELIALNENLEERVMLEVGKNKKKEQLLMQQSRLAQMGEMISMIAHQWRQPLSAISTAAAYLKLLIDLGNHNEQLLTEGLTQVELYVQHLSQTIDDFRNFFKPDKEKEITTLNEIIQKSLAIIGTSLENNNISVIFDNKNHQELNLYAHEIMQVVLNILKNAEDIFIERKIVNPMITITCYEDMKNYYLGFEDNAKGIDAEIIGKVFDPYFSTKNEKNGTGLGLYMSKVIVKEHCHGNLEVENTIEGAKFVISLPKEASTPTPS